MYATFPLPPHEALCDCYWCFLVSLNPLWELSETEGEA